MLCQVNIHCEIGIRVAQTQLLVMLFLSLQNHKGPMSSSSKSTTGKDIIEWGAHRPITVLDQDYKMYTTIWQKDWK